MITIAFCCFHSEHHILRLAKKISKKFPIIIIDNSRNFEFKNLIEKKFLNIKVFIPKKNIGEAAAYNLAIRNSKTNLVMLNNPDIDIDTKTLKRLYILSRKLKKFSVLGLTYKNNSIFESYGSENRKQHLKYKFLIEADWIDNCFIVNKKEIGKVRFDENFFLYFETYDFCKLLKNEKKNLCLFKT